MSCKISKLIGDRLRLGGDRLTEKWRSPKLHTTCKHRGHPQF